MPKIYTKTGDKGLTSLYNGDRLPKSDIIFEVLGDMDELSAHLGNICCIDTQSIRENDLEFLRNIQRKLLEIGSIIAKASKIPPFPYSEVDRIEIEIDKITASLPELKVFLVIGTSKTESAIQIARAVSRRLERHAWRIDLDKNILIYFNRLSDYLFTLGRVYSSNEIRFKWGT